MRERHKHPKEEKHLKHLKEHYKGIPANVELVALSLE